MLNTVDDEFFEKIWQDVSKKLFKSAKKYYSKIPYSSEKGVYDDMSHLPSMWTNGFWSALMLIMYYKTKEEQFLKTARSACDILDAALLDYFSLNHDVGFMWDISSGADYRLTGNEKQLNRLMMAASYMMSRYNCEGEFIRAWNDADQIGWTIIDSMMNLPILYRASEITGDDRFKYVAMHHADKTLKYHLKEVGACSHIVEYNPINGDFIKTHTGQGFDENSCWARGQAWAIYGFALSYKFTREKRYIEAAMRAADYFIKQFYKWDQKLPCDFMQPKSPSVYDSSSGACAVCGILEISKYCEKSVADEYIKNAKIIITHLYNDYFDNTGDAILRGGTEAYNRGRNKTLIYGDYFFTEAIMRIMGYDVDFVW